MKYKKLVKPLANGSVHKLEWNEKEVSEKVSESFQWRMFCLRIMDLFQVKIDGPDNSVAIFHPLWSNGTAAIRCSRPINRNRSKCYWEVTVKDRLFGTSMMVGVCTSKARLQCDSFINLIGEDENGWGLSHKGLLWHSGQWQVYTQPFRENRTTVIGCLYDGLVGTLTFYKDGVNLGLAFTNLHLVRENLFPCVSSTAAKTQFHLSELRREFCNLQERCRSVIREHLYDDTQLKSLHASLPHRILSFLRMEEEHLGSEYIIEDVTPKRFKAFTVQSYVSESYHAHPPATFTSVFSSSSSSSSGSSGSFLISPSSSTSSRTQSFSSSSSPFSISSLPFSSSSSLFSSSSSTVALPPENLFGSRPFREDKIFTKEF